MRLLIKINRSELIDEVAIRFCKLYKLLDESVCTGAVNEFKVKSNCFELMQQWRTSIIDHHLQTSVIQVLALSALSTKDLCSLAFECKSSSSFPLIQWNVTFPNKPKPIPKPPQAPEVYRSAELWQQWKRFSSHFYFLVRCTEAKNFTSIRYSCGFLIQTWFECWMFTTALLSWRKSR